MQRSMASTSHGGPRPARAVGLVPANWRGQARDVIVPEQRPRLLARTRHVHPYTRIEPPARVMDSGR